MNHLMKNTMRVMVQRIINIYIVCVCVCVCILDTRLEDKMSKKSLERCQICPAHLKT